MEPLILPTTPTGAHALPLTPQAMIPLHLSKGAEASQRLSRIEWVEIAGTEQHEDKTYYILHIFVHRSDTLSHIPTSPANRDQAATHRLAKPTRSEPDYRIHRRMSEFVQLRDELIFTVQGPHKKYCHFCNDILNTLIYSTTRFAIGVRALIASTDRRARVLDKLLHEVLAEYQSKRPLVHTRDACAAIENVPCILHEFLFGHEQLSIL